MIVNNVIGLAKTAKAFDVPVILKTVVAGRGGKIIKGIQDVFPNNEVIDRTFINTWQDERVVTAVKATKRKKLVFRCGRRCVLQCRRSRLKERDLRSTL